MNLAAASPLRDSFEYTSCFGFCCFLLLLVGLGVFVVCFGFFTEFCCPSGVTDEPGMYLVLTSNKEAGNQACFWSRLNLELFNAVLPASVHIHILCPRPNTGTKCLDLGYAFMETKDWLLECGEEDEVWKKAFL